jgi:prepilin peptidase CpaA
MFLSGLTIILKLALVALFCKIGFVDFSEQKIRNDDVLAVLGIGIATMVVSWLGGADVWVLGLSVIAALVLFCLLIPFWLLGKVGAGDVKFLAISPLVVGGGHDLILFSVVLLVAAAATALIIKNPILLPEGVFRRYIQFFDRKQVVPFGVPISISLIVVLVLQIVRIGFAAA